MSSANELFEKEKNDPAMIAYLKSLGIDPDYVPPKDDPRRVVISKLEIVFKDHQPAIINVETVRCCVFGCDLYHFGFLIL